MRSLILVLGLVFNIQLQAQTEVNMSRQQILLENLLSAADSRGLPRDIYINDTTPAILNQAEIVKIASLIASDLSRGHILPTDISDRVRINPKKFTKQAEVQKYLNETISLNDLFLQIEPKNQLYIQQLRILNHLKAMKNSGWANAPRGTLPLLKIGSNAPNSIKYLRARLANLGYTSDITNTVFDIELAALVMDFQNDHKLEADGVVGSKSWTYLNRDINQLITQALINLDRTRWLPDSLESERIFVNLAEQNFKFYQNNQIVMDFNTINGRLDRQTPMMIDMIKNVVLNPTWTVPFSIFVKDKLPLIQQDPGVIARLNMKLIDDLTGQETDPYSVDWSQMDATNLHYTLVQLPGPWNALGFIKFPLQNPYAIYLHDTDSRNLFAKSERLFSSGCVRLQQPFELAEKILENPKWTVDTLKMATEENPMQATEQTWLKTKRNIPVYLFYLTQFLKNDSKIVILNDAYGIDLLMYNKIMGIEEPEIQSDEVKP
ncbi:L,D-transpeptidase family protein [bacterium]|nr:L,D-transpeptidase family protein [bacterium]